MPSASLDLDALERSPASPDEKLATIMATFADDPLGFVRFAYPWGEPGALKDYDGPDTWQVSFLKGIGEEVKRNGFNGLNAVAPIRRAVSSGHGIGKSVMVAWLVGWIMSTRPHCQGTVTANTFTQLETKTWAAIQRWMKLCITAHWFSVTSNRIYQTDHKESWFVAPQSSKEDNSEAFAGQHAADSTSFYIFDEDSAVPDIIHEVAEGGLTDGEPMIFCFGNPTRNSGHFYDAAFGRMRSRWNPTVVDSRTSKFTNKAQIAEWAEDYGDDSDFFRVRVLGLPPSASDAQFIDQSRVTSAQKRQVVVIPDEPLVAGADLAWGGGDDNVIRFRRGLDARSIPPIRIKGEFTRDPSVLTTRLADVLSREYDGHKVSMLFLDSAGIAGPIAARLRALGHRNVQEVNFGSDSPDTHYRYMRDFMWGSMKEWLLQGAIDSHPELEADLTGPGIRPDNRQRVWLESKETMKKRGVDSPDDGDALALTFAAPVKAPRTQSRVSLPEVFAWS
jgi:hypothetical protein